MFRRHPLLSLATFAYLALVGWVTLTPVSGAEQGTLRRISELVQRVPGLHWVTFSGLEFTANIAMFVPFGVFFVLLLGRRRWWLAILVGVGLTCGIEFAQQFIPSRVSDVRDLISNSVGTVLGTFLALVLTASKARAARISARSRYSG